MLTEARVLARVNLLHSKCRLIVKFRCEGLDKMDFGYCHCAADADPS